MSITPSSAPVPDFESIPPPRKRVLWKWSLVVTAVVLAFLLWQCGSGLVQGRSLSARAVHHFHQQFNNGQYEDIWAEAEEAFESSGKKQELLDFLAAVHRKLGNAGIESLSNLNVNATMNGTFITAVYSTTFDRGPAIETFTWKRHGGEVKLYSYNIQSRALITN